MPRAKKGPQKVPALKEDDPALPLYSTVLFYTCNQEYQWNLPQYEVSEANYNIFIVWNQPKSKGSVLYIVQL